MANLSRIKILEVIPSISPAFGGPSEVIINLTRELRVLGIDAEIATTNDNLAGVMDVPLKQRVIYQQVPVWFFPRFPIRMKEYLFSAELTYWLWRNVKNYNILNSHYLFTYPSDCLSLMARVHHIPYGIRTIGQLTPWSLSQSALKKTVYMALIERQNLNQAAYIHCTTLAEAQDVNRIGIQSPKVVIPLGVNPPTLISNASAKLRSQFSIKNQEHQFHLLIAGSGTDKYVSSLHHLVSEHNLEAQTTFTGFLTGEEKDLLIQGSDIFVLPSYSENFGVVVAEAMAAGLPVILSSEVQISSDISKAQAGIIIDHEDQLQSAIIELLQSSQRRQELGKNGKHLAFQKYSWPSIALQFAEVYTQILDQNPIPPLYFPLQSSDSSLSTTKSMLSGDK
jgi:glycosyltransferase involved in cell wall biosynthesis